MLRSGDRLTLVYATAAATLLLLLAVPPLVLGIRRQWTDLERFVTVVLGALFTCYVGFVLVPVLGPASALPFATPALQGYVVVPLQQFVMTHGDPPGTFVTRAGAVRLRRPALAVQLQRPAS